MSKKQWKRLDVMERLAGGRVTGREAAMLLGLSERQVRRLRRAYEREGAAGLAHGNRGRAPACRLDDETRERIVELRRGRYAGLNDRHFTEKLVEVEGVAVSRATVQRVLRQEGIASPRRRRSKQHRRRRDRKPQAGLMLQWDGSRHDWLEGRGPRLCLMGAIDDATGELMEGAHFVEQECAAGYLRVLLSIARARGLPHVIYMDRHGSLRRNDDHWTLEEELRGEQDPTQVGRALRALGITPIYALSPQAKGRIERAWGTAQDRLISELRLAQASTKEHANAVLDAYRADVNRRFRVPPAEAEPAWRPVPRGVDLDRVCSFFYEATVGNDNAVRLCGVTIDIPPGPAGRSYAKARVEVRQLLDGSWRVYAQDRCIATASPTHLGELRAAKRTKRSAASRAFRKAITQLSPTLP